MELWSLDGVDDGPRVKGGDWVTHTPAVWEGGGGREGWFSDPGSLLGASPPPFLPLSPIGGGGACRRYILRHEGVRGFYAGLTPHILRTIPSTAVTFAVSGAPHPHRPTRRPS